MSKHRGEPRRCKTCHMPEDNHSKRHPFVHPDYPFTMLWQQPRALVRRWDRA